jgi:hypothetical protein
LLPFFVVMLAWFWLLALLFPLRAGRDMMTYFLWFRDVFAVHPEFPLLMLFPTFLTPLFLANDPLDPIFTAFTLFAASGLFAWVRKFLLARVRRREGRSRDPSMILGAQLAR